MVEDIATVVVKVNTTVFSCITIIENWIGENSPIDYKNIANYASLVIQKAAVEIIIILVARIIAICRKEFGLILLLVHSTMWLLLLLMYFDLNMQLDLMHADLIIYSSQVWCLITSVFDIVYFWIFYHKFFQLGSYSLYPNFWDYHYTPSRPTLLIYWSGYHNFYNVWSKYYEKYNAALLSSRCYYELPSNFLWSSVQSIFK